MAQAIAPSSSDRPDAARTGDVPTVVKAHRHEARRAQNWRAALQLNDDVGRPVGTNRAASRGDRASFATMSRRAPAVSTYHRVPT